MKWKTDDSSYLIRDRWLRLRSDSCRMPDGTVVEPYYVFEYPDWINVLALTDRDEVVLTRQYRHGMGEVVLELPSGCVDPEDPSPMDCARRELLEETGYSGAEFYRTSVTSPNPANHSNRVYSFLVTGVRKTADIRLDESEDIETVLLPLDEFIRMFENNEFSQAMHVTAIYYGLKKLRELRSGAFGPG